MNFTSFLSFLPPLPYVIVWLAENARIIFVSALHDLGGRNYVQEADLRGCSQSIMALSADELGDVGRSRQRMPTFWVIRKVAVRVLCRILEL